MVRVILIFIKEENYEKIQRVDRKILFESLETSAKFSLSFADEDLSYRDL